VAQSEKLVRRIGGALPIPTNSPFYAPSYFCLEKQFTAEQT
jgi:hypothetical protein